MWRPAFAGPVAAVVLVVGACSQVAEPRTDQPEPVAVSPPSTAAAAVQPRVTSRPADDVADAGDKTDKTDRTGKATGTDPADKAVAVVEAVRAAWASCSAAPSACRPEVDLAAVYGGPLLAVASDQIAEWVARGWAVRPPLDPVHDRFELLAVSGPAGDDEEEFEVRYCEVDGRVLVDAGGTVPTGGTVLTDGTVPTDDEIVVDERISSMVRVATLRRSPDGRWLMVGRYTDEIFDGGDGCRP